MLTDTELVRRARLGDAQAFGELVRRHQAALYRVALAIVRSPADAEDVTQNAWLQAFSHVSRFQGESAVTTWLVAIVRNQAIDHQRAIGRWRREVEDVPVDTIRDEYVSRLPSPEAIVLGNEQRAYVTHALRALPPRLRMTLGLWHSGKYTYEEIAEIAGVATGTIKSRIWTARQHITQEVRSKSSECAA